jgi:glutaryl-CoA dehydrogenase (non-decarboxylating)
MDFDLTDEQRLIQETVRNFVDERVLPNAIQNDIDHRLDLGVIEGMAELGLLGIVIPEEYGGAGLDFVAEALSCEEIERGEAAFRTLVSVHVGLNSLSLLRYASEEQKQRWLVPQAKGEKLACFGLTEPGAGSDVASMKTTARREGDVYVLNGQKNWISYASVADHALVFAKTDPGAKHKGISAFVVEKGTKGFTTADTEHKLGVWAGSTGELFFENVELPAENLIGDEGQGFEIAMYGLDQGRFTVAAGACGVVRACLERSVEYARERETFGRPIGKYQFVQDMIAKMVLGYETSKLLVMQAAWMKNEGRRNTRETSLAKWHATESAFEAANLAIQVHGSYGYSAEYGIERYFRNARAPIIYEGTTQIHKLMQAEHALGFRQLNGRGGEVSPLCSWAPALAPVHREPVSA